MFETGFIPQLSGIMLRKLKINALTAYSHPSPSHGDFIPTIRAYDMSQGTIKDYTLSPDIIAQTHHICIYLIESMKEIS